ncbi:hypothetical protein [Effusibacillus pohliae]|nr:hypothetical protein [Effusibacillus pohliae]
MFPFAGAPGAGFWGGWSWWAIAFLIAFIVFFGIALVGAGWAGFR